MTIPPRLQVRQKFHEWLHSNNTAGGPVLHDDICFSNLQSLNFFIHALCSVVVFANICVISCYGVLILLMAMMMYKLSNFLVTVLILLLHWIGTSTAVLHFFASSLVKKQETYFIFIHMNFLAGKKFR